LHPTGLPASDLPTLLVRPLPPEHPRQGEFGVPGSVRLPIHSGEAGGAVSTQSSFFFFLFSMPGPAKPASRPRHRPVNGPLTTCGRRADYGRFSMAEASAFKSVARVP